MAVDFTWEIKTRIHFGTNIYEDALQKERKLTKGSMLIVTTGHTLKENGTIARIEDILRQNGTKNVATYIGHGANPEITEAEAAGKIAREINAQAVLGIGGGSAMDLAKAAAIAAVSDVPLRDYLTKGIDAPEDTLPIIAMPTTAGTGSELSKGAIMSDTELGIKGGIRGEHVAPRVAIVDAALTWTMPERLTMETGFDAFAHAAESYMSLKANPMSEMLSIKVIQLIGENLPKLKQDLDNHDARERMSCASMMMGMNLYNVGNCLPHRMQYPIGALTHTSHAAGLAALYQAWIGEEYKICSERVNDIYEALGIGKPQSADDAREKMKAWLKTLGIANTLEDLGVKADEIDGLVSKVTGNIASDRLARQDGIIKRIYEESQ
ncbi:MAG: iron-containing alcohol dehydrogenase [Selenomonadaceae bacterium]